MIDLGFLGKLQGLDLTDLEATRLAASKALSLKLKRVDFDALERYAGKVRADDDAVRVAKLDLGLGTVAESPAIALTPFDVPTPDLTPLAPTADEAKRAAILAALNNAPRTAVSSRRVKAPSPYAALGAGYEDAFAIVDFDPRVYKDASGAWACKAEGGIAYDRVSPRGAQRFLLTALAAFKDAGLPTVLKDVCEACVVLAQDSPKDSDRNRP